MNGAGVFDKAIIEKLRHDLGFKDPGIFEKAVYALNLLPSLLDVYPDLIFKGGDNSFKEITSINRGMERVRNHLVVNVDSGALKLIFGRIAYVLKLTGGHKTAKILKTVDLSTVKDLRLEGKFKILEGLRKAQAEAYGYWALAAGTG